MKLTTKRRNEIAYNLYLVQRGENGMHFAPIGKKGKKIIKKLGMKRAELVEFARGMAGDLAKASFKKK